MLPRALPLPAVVSPVASLVRRDLALTLLALLGLLAWDASGADLAASRLVADGHGFAWRDAWLTSHLLHDGGRWLAGGVLAWLLLDLLRPSARHRLTRQVRAAWAGVVLASLLLVPSLKRVSLSSCPWDLADFGGAASYVSHWQWGVADGGPGHCFPSGHAVAAFAFFGLYFQWRAVAPARARAWLVGTLVLGAAFGAAQWLRGAHFVSHTLWTAWICWLLAVAAAHAPRAAGVLGRALARIRLVVPGLRPAAPASPAAPAAAAPRPAPAAARRGRRAGRRRSAARSGGRRR